MMLKSHLKSENYIPGRYASVQIGMDFANDKDTTVYLLKNGEKQMTPISRYITRYITLREKSTGRYLAIGNLQGELVTSTTEDIRCAFVFDTENKDILTIAEEMLTDEYYIEYLI